MRSFARLTILVTLLYCAMLSIGLCHNVAHAQSSTNQTPAATGSITGRVTINGQPTPGVIVALQSASATSWQRDSLAEATTDTEGRYQLTGMAAGDYSVWPLAPGLSMANAADLRFFPKFVRVTEGAAITSIDFALTRGGVITGRVIDLDGQPLIREFLNLFSIDERGQKQRYASRITSTTMFSTDDRGVYRIYGLPAGRYLISVGKSSESFFSLETSGAYYPLTFFPNVTEETQATIIEVRPGEVNNADLTVGRPIQSHTVSGRVVDGETGQPIPHARVASAPIKSDGQLVRPFTGSFAGDAQGNFHYPGLLPGRYAFTLYAPETGYYSEQVTAEVIDRDVTRLEIKARRGATMSGVFSLEGNANPAVLALLPQLQVFLSQPRSDMPYLRRPLSINAESSFSMQGLVSRQGAD